MKESTSSFVLPWNFTAGMADMIDAGCEPMIGGCNSIIGGGEAGSLIGGEIDSIGGEIAPTV